MRGLFFPVLLGVVGVGILLWLGFWQLQRLEWKRDVLHGIEQRMISEPVALPISPTEADDEYLAVTLSGTPGSQELHVLSSGTGAGTGYRVISAFVTPDGRRVLLDQGILQLTDKDVAAAAQPAEITGNLIWPDDKTSATPEPDIDNNIWFGREVASMAAALNTEEIMIVLRSSTAPDLRLIPVPVDTRGITNDHREYAITWFLLALVWTAMSVALITRQLKKAKS